MPRSTRLEEYSNQRARFLASTEANGTEVKDSQPNFSKIAETQPSKPAKDLVTKKREKQAHYFNKGAKRLKELKPGDIVRMKLDQEDRKKLWKKATCLQEVAPRFYEAHIEGTRVRKDLVATQESPEIDNHVGESDGPRITDGQSQRVIDPVQPRMPLPEDTAQERPETSQRAPEIPQPTPRRSTRGRLIRTPIRLKDYSKP